MSEKTKMLSIFTVSRADLLRVLIHVPVGLVAGFSYFAHWIFVPTIMGIFAFYEKRQNKYMKDQDWKDTKGAIWGLGAAGVVIAIVKLLELI